MNLKKNNIVKSLIISFLAIILISLVSSTVFADEINERNLTNDTQVNTANLNLSVENNDENFENTTTFISLLTTDNGTPISGKTINFFINDQIIGSNTTNDSGIAIHSCSFDFQENSIYQIKVNFIGDEEFLNSTSVITYTTNSNNSSVANTTENETENSTKNNQSLEPTLTINLSSEAINLEENITLTAILKDNENNPIYGEIKFYINDILNESIYTDENGEAIYILTPKEIGNYNIKAIFTGNENITEINSTTKTLSVINNTKNESLNYLNSTLNLTTNSNSIKGGNKLVFTANLTDSSNENPIANKSISFYQNGKLIGSNITNEDGIAKLYFIVKPKTTIGKCKINCIFQGDESTNESESLNKTISILKPNSKLVFSFSPVPTYTDDKISFSGKLTYANKEAINGKTVKVYYKKTLLGTGKTNNKGIAKISIKFKYIGNFKITAKFTGDSKVEATSTSDYLKIERRVFKYSTKTKDSSKKKIFTRQITGTNLGSTIKIKTFKINLKSLRKIGYISKISTTKDISVSLSRSYILTVTLKNIKPYSYTKAKQIIKIEVTKPK
ncbi:MAG: Ig-like domain-containing protein [Methanobrevibacter sp.]|jgi:hypothetical protein|nr:Ig-like domain-containing protein [Methanobrevibacter sp.]